MRRTHVAALCAAAGLLLLLLARLPPTPPPHPLRPRAYVRPESPAPPAPAAPAAAAVAPVSSSSDVSQVSNTTRSAPSVPPPAPAPTAPPKPAPKPKPKPKPGEEPPLMTRDLYEAGHERAHPELCPALGAKLQLLILVSSAPSHAAARDAVRLTWGHYAARSDVALAFVLGAPPASLRPALKAEDALYGDVVLGRSVDSYSNLTLKTLSMLEWADSYCPRAPRLLKTDDDMFINVPRLLRFAAARANQTRSIWGRVERRSLPKRQPSSKYYVSPKQFPGKVFPDFATGPAYLLTSDCIRPLLEAAKKERYVRLEDVFVTGVLASRLGLSRVHAPEFYNRRVAPGACAVQRGLALHMVRYHEQFDLWRRLLDGRSACPPAPPRKKS